MLQQKVGDLLISPERDFVHIFPAVAMEMAEILDGGHFPVLDDWIADKKVREEELGAAMVAFVNFVGSVATDPSVANYYEALKKCNWNSLPSRAKFCILAVLGACMMRRFFNGVRDATFNKPPTMLPHFDGMERSAVDVVNSLNKVTG